MKTVGLCLFLLCTLAPAQAQHHHHHHHHHSPAPAQHPHEHHAGEAEEAIPEAAAACAPEHAAMGHCTLAPAAAEAHEPVPPLSDAERAAAFPVLHTAHAHAAALHWKVQINELEAGENRHAEKVQAWSIAAWLGGDIHRLRLKSAGQRNAKRTESAQFSALYSRSITAWWDWVMGARHEWQPQGRTWAAMGVQGLAPHFFDIEAMLYAGHHGQWTLELEAGYEVLLTNRLILQPEIKLHAALKNEAHTATGSGLGRVETGLRLRHEISRQFAPYIGLVHERHVGNTARMRHDSGGHARETRVVAGVRVWF